MRLQLCLALSALVFTACGGPSRTDYDNDGITADVDCDDFNESVGSATLWFVDVDGDGFGDADAGSTESCDRPDGHALRSGDCADDDPGRSPAAEEACNSVDDDCDGFVDENTAMGKWYLDNDGDGFGDPETGAEACDGTGGFVQNRADCDDKDEDVHPGQDEVCDGKDNDCDARTDEEDAVDAKNWYLDADGDEYGRNATEVHACNAPSDNWSEGGNDCNDDDDAINPGAEERCDGFDNNCDGSADGSEAVDATDWLADRDGDNFGNDDDVLRACLQPDGYVVDGGDCDDRNRFMNPDTVWFKDVDKDGYGNPDDTTASCVEVTGYVDNMLDCDDTEKIVNPGATEECDGIDNDCDGSTDGGDAIDAITYYMDFDDDGYGDADRTGKACSRPDGFTTDSSDCDDDNPDTYPGAEEYCDGLDNDCDTLVDHADPDVVKLTWYLDSDSDLWGSDDEDDDTEVSCEKPEGHVKRDGDCDDDNRWINPDAVEVCDAGVDNDCDGLVDKDDPDMAGDGTWYRDADGDGHGNPDIKVITCVEPKGYVRKPDDCDDSDRTKYDTCWSGIRNFTNCSATGQNGPSQSACDGAYGKGYLSGEVTVKSGIQEWTVPQDGTYRIEAWGAQGHSAQSGRAGGKGARMRGDFDLDKGDVLKIIIGQEGKGNGCSGGGGGGSWIVDGGGSPLLIAGGGGGTRTSVSQNGCSGRVTGYAGTGSLSGATWGCGAKSSALGNGGIVSSGSWGSAGGGLNSNGAGEYNSLNGGRSYKAGAKGGGSGGSYNAYGGFGTAGAGNGSCGGGGGGGYSGGDGGRVAGGGGSYNDGTDTSNSSGTQSSHGKVSIDWLKP